MEIPKLTKDTSEWETLAILAVKKLGWFWVVTANNNRYLLANEEYVTRGNTKRPDNHYIRVTEGKWPKETDYASSSSSERYMDWNLPLASQLDDTARAKLLLHRDAVIEEDSKMSTLDKIYYSRAITIVLFGEEREPTLADIYEISTIDEDTLLKVQSQMVKLREQEAF